MSKCLLDEDEVAKVIAEIIRSSRSEAELRQLLTDVGFNMETVTIASLEWGSLFLCAMVTIVGSQGTIVSV
jgi:hypothetical protein